MRAARRVRRSSRTRRSRRSPATSSPSAPVAAASCAVLPPGAAHTSATRLPAAGAANAPTSCDASSCARNAPSCARAEPSGRPDSTTSPSGACAHGLVVTPSRWSRSASWSRVVSSVFARRVSGAGALLKRAHASAASNPYLSSQRAASHDGWDQVVLRQPIGSEGGGHGMSCRPLLMRRRIAFTAPAARAWPRWRASVTASLTAAEAGTRSRWSSW